MPETPQQFYERVAAAAEAQPGGRLAIPPEFTESDIFPFETDGLKVKEFLPPVAPEPARNGDPGGTPCDRCARRDQGAIWANDRWWLTAAPIPSAPFAGLLYPHRHLDFPDLDDEMAGEMGQLMVAIERAVKTAVGVGRVHVSIVGDGASHLHVWFIARPLGQLQLRGSCYMDWVDLLPSRPEPDLRADRQAVVQALVASVGGESRI